MCMDERNVSKPAMRGHKLVLNNRTASLVTGVKDVLSFDLNEVLLETEHHLPDRYGLSDECSAYP